jgi:predicted permease
VIGKVIQLGTHSLTVVGVSPASFFGLQVGTSWDITFPITIDHTGSLNDSGAWFLNAIGRLKSRLSPEQASAQLDVVFQTFISEQKMSAQFKHDYFDHMALLPADRGEGNLREMLSKPLLVLTALVGLILLICCANIGNLLLARTIARQREFAIRFAVGANRRRVFRQLLTETLLLFFMGATLALAFASWATSIITGFLASSSPVHLNVHLDFPVLGYTAGITFMTALLFRLAPAIGATRVNPRAAMQSNEALQRSSKWSARRLLIVSQVSLSLIALVGAGLFIRTLQNLRKVDPGFRPSGVLLMTLTPQGPAYSSARLTEFWTESLGRIRTMPGVKFASLVALTPFTHRRRGSTIDVPGFQPSSEAAKEIQEIQMNQVSDGYFETMGIPVLLGRAFHSADNAAAPKVAMINEASAKFYFGNRNPIGTQIDLGKSPVSDGRYQIVGIVKDSKQHDLREVASRFIFIPVAQSEDLLTELTLAVRTTGNPTFLAPQIRQLVQNLGPDIAITNVTTLSAQEEQTLLRERLVSIISSFFGVLALLVASIGLYGLMSYSVRQRTKEIGIRIALGSQKSSICWLILREAFVIVGIGIAVGIPGAFLLARAAQSLAYGFQLSDPSTIFGCAVLLAMVALFASYIPARRAMKTDPMVALRYE